MHSANVILLLIILLPALMIAWFRINAVFLFFSLCLGYVLSGVIGGDSSSLLSLFSKSFNSPTVTQPDTLKLIVLFIPVLLTAMFMFKSVKKNRALLNLIPAFCFSVLALILISPLISRHLLLSYSQSSFYLQLVKAKDLILELISLVILFFLFLDRLNRRHHT